MGLSVSVATVIIFSAVVLMAADFVQTYDDVANETREAMDERDSLSLERGSTSIEVIDVTRNETNLTVNVTNVGTEVLDPRECDIIVDGELATGRIRWGETMVIGHPGTSVWGPGETASYSMRYGTDPTRIIVITGNGVSGTYTGV